ncbi:MAG: hypothetical protein HN842_10790 [Gammaproteobacteria bacterium]|jgi:hypothetical protein|nr:hypothetical protein [Gammaproteobacteria bacterium]MBT7308695.1 hypothetical protein [Gammaproteobacteria bacterium]
MNWIDRIPLGHLVLIAIMLAIMPAIIPPHPEPHLVEKVRMLLEGSLSKPIDIFDLFLHGLPITLLTIRLLRIALGYSAPSSTGSE